MCPETRYLSAVDFVLYKCQIGKWGEALSEALVLIFSDSSRFLQTVTLTWSTTGERA